MPKITYFFTPIPPLHRLYLRIIILFLITDMPMRDLQAEEDKRPEQSTAEGIYLSLINGAVREDSSKVK